jgi:hypothetical protein
MAFNIDSIILFFNPWCIVLFALALAFLLLDIFIKKIKYIFKIGFAISFIPLIILELLFGAELIEILIIVLLFLIILLYSFYPPKKRKES